MQYPEYPLEPYNRQDKLPSLPGMSLKAFMEQTTTYENLPAPFSPRLRQGAWTGMALTLIGTIVVLLLSEFGGNIFPSFFFILSAQRDTYLHWMTQSPLIAYIDGLLFGFGVVLLIQTRNLRRGRPIHQWLALVQALGGTTNLLMLTIPIILVLINVAFWLLVAIAAIFLVVVIVRILVAIL